MAAVIGLSGAKATVWDRLWSCPGGLVLAAIGEPEEAACNSFRFVGRRINGQMED